MPSNDPAIAGGRPASAAPDPAAQPDAYIASLLDALAGRDPLQVMRETPAALRRLLDGVAAGKLGEPEKPGKWSLAQVVQHLADSEIVGAFRFRMTLAHDRPPIPGYDQDRWASRLHYDRATLALALEQFDALRACNLRLLLETTPAERARVGIHAERGEESLTRMMEMYAGHDLVHQRQLARIKSAIGG